MKEWFTADPFIATLYILAVSATVILVLQTILLLFGLGHGDGDFDSDVSGIGDGGIDLDGDGIPDIDVPDAPDSHDFPDSHGQMEGDTGLRLVTVRGVVAFFAVGGWAGIAALELGASRFVAAVAALMMGFAALLLVAYFFKWAMSLQYNGTLNMANAVGKTGEVYITVPAKSQGSGKVNVVIQERLTEAEAVTECERPLKYGEKVRVVGKVGDGLLVVEPLSADK